MRGDLSGGWKSVAGWLENSCRWLLAIFIYEWSEMNRKHNAAVFPFSPHRYVDIRGAESWPSSAAKTIQLEPKIQRVFVFSMMPDYWKSKFHALMMPTLMMMTYTYTYALPAGRCSCSWSWVPRKPHFPFPTSHPKTELESTRMSPSLPVFVCFGHKAELSSALNARGFVGWMEKRRRLIGK